MLRMAVRRKSWKAKDTLARRRALNQAAEKLPTSMSSGRRRSSLFPAIGARLAGRVVVRVLAVNPRPRTSIHENRLARPRNGAKHGGERPEAPSNHLGWTARVDVGWRGRRDSNPAGNTTNRRRLNSLSFAGRRPGR